MNLVNRTCRLKGCGGRFRVLSTSKQQHCAQYHAEEDGWIPKGWKGETGTKRAKPWESLKKERAEKNYTGALARGDLSDPFDDETSDASKEIDSDVNVPTTWSKKEKTKTRSEKRIQKNQMRKVEITIKPIGKQFVKTNGLFGIKTHLPTMKTKGDYMQITGNTDSRSLPKVENAGVENLKQPNEPTESTELKTATNSPSRSSKDPSEKTPRMDSIVPSMPLDVVRSPSMNLIDDTANHLFGLMRGLTVNKPDAEIRLMNPDTVAVAVGCAKEIRELMKLKVDLTRIYHDGTKSR